MRLAFGEEGAEDEQGKVAAQGGGAREAGRAGGRGDVLVAEEAPEDAQVDAVLEQPGVVDSCR